MRGKEIKLLGGVLVLALAGAVFYFSNSLRVEKDFGLPQDGPAIAERSPVEEVQTTPPPLPEIKTAPKIRAAGAYLLESGGSLYLLNEEKSWPIASITKLMTALVSRELIPVGEVVTMTEEAVAASGEVGDFKVDERFRSEDLVRAMLISSSNDAAKALAMHYGEAAFVARMNEKAKALGMSRTNFTDPTGLSPQNISTAGDLRVLVAAIWFGDPQIFSITRLPTTTLVDIDTERSRKLVSTIAFTTRSDFLGGKTGQLPEANGNLLSIFDLPEYSSPVVVIVLGAQDRFEETKKILAKL